MSRPRILYVHSRKASFVAIDRAILAERYEVEDYYQPGRLPHPLRLLAAIRRCDGVVGWFASSPPGSLTGGIVAAEEKKGHSACCRPFSGEKRYVPNGTKLSVNLLLKQVVA